MRKEIADWVAALRSGEYKQGRQMLNCDNQFCCLGVLCEVLEIPKIQILNYYEYGFDRSHNMLPVEVWKRLNISLSGRFNPKAIDFEERVNTLWAVNDELRWDFNRIADLIEEIENADAWL